MAISRQSLVWKGGELTEKMRAAQVKGVNSTMAAGVDRAKEHHPWKNQTGILEGSYQVAEYAKEVSGGVEGSWGSLDNEYALIQELGGTIKHPGGTPYFIDADTKLAVFVSRKAPGAGDLPKTKPHDITLPARPALRPAADFIYPSLPQNIRISFEGGTGPYKADG